MPRRIEEDHKNFRDVYSGRIRKELKKFVNNGQIFRLRGDGKRVPISIPRIDIPHIVYGSGNSGIGRGEGKPGDVIGKDDQEGKGQRAGQGEADGIVVSVDMEDVLHFLKDELNLPDLKPKPNETFEEIKIKYNDISLIGPESLRHNRRTMLQALKRLSATGQINDLHMIPGFENPVKLITPINSDKRYRQYKEIRIPSSNAVIFFARDCSGSMDDYKCDIVSDMAWWIDIWIRRFYKRVERCYILHDSAAEEVDENKFYKYRHGGGTTCSSAFKLISKQFENRFPPEKWNSYVFYFTDGDNWGSDNQVLVDELKSNFSPEIVNFVGITQVLSWSYQSSVKEFVDQNLGDMKNIKTVEIAPKDTPSMSSGTAHSFYGTPQLTEEERNEQIKNAIKGLLGKQKKTVG